MINKILVAFNALLDLLFGAFKKALLAMILIAMFASAFTLGIIALVVWIVK